MEFDTRFSTDAGCREYLAQLRWVDGFICPQCSGRIGWPVREILYECKDCGCQTSVTANTIFHRSHIPLSVWFRAMWWVTSQKNGASALNLKRILGLGSYETAWMLLHKLRRAMVREGRDKLAGVIEVDETYIGGLEVGLRGRKIENKALVIVAAQEDGKGIGRIRMKRIGTASAAYLHGFIESVVVPGSTIHTDGWEGYTGLSSKGYVHEITILKKRKESASELLPRVHRVISLLKRWLMGTHQGAISNLHLDYYLDEFTFRFNRRKSQHRGKLFYRLVEQAAQSGHIGYGTIVKHVRELRNEKHNR